MNEIPESELWECSTCKQPHPIETDYECASCGMLASEHISVTAMCRIIREWQSRAYSAELKLARIERELDYLNIQLAHSVLRELRIQEQRDRLAGELNELKEEYGTWWAQKRIAIDELKDVTEQRDRLADALRTAYGLIFRHHECGVRQELGCYCPVCHREDGTEPEMDQIIATLDAVKGESDMHPCPKCDALSEPDWPCRICGTPLSTEKPPALRELFCEGCKALPATEMTQCTMNRGGIKEQGEPETEPIDSPK
jgi:hypothetical protein